MSYALPLVLRGVTPGSTLPSGRSSIGVPSPGSVGSNGGEHPVYTRGQLSIGNGSAQVFVGYNADNNSYEQAAFCELTPMLVGPCVSDIFLVPAGWQLTIINPGLTDLSAFIIFTEN